ncbi:Serpin B9 [Thelohanellus kitauei]|uniref:Serpin B9 n=1 Tax=Thelohanellus kitauei TaxID=669202 RepID=A0A0C2ILR6_THEKT|nr:Serpin B9 [Thelohanellus kitauei]
MPVNRVNNFTSLILNHLYAAQNASGNIAIRGISLYALFGAISVGLEGTSYQQLSNFLGVGFEELFDLENWRKSDSANDWFMMRYLGEKSSRMNTAVFSPYDTYNIYQSLTKLICRLDHIQFDHFEPYDSVEKMNNWTYQRSYGWIKNMFPRSILGEDRMIFFDTSFIDADFVTEFDAAYTQREMFYDEQGEVYEVDMMNQENYERIYDSRDDIFRILFKPLARSYLFSAIVLPKMWYIVDHVLRTLDFDKINNYFKRSSMKYAKLKLPKFQIVSQNNFNNLFKDFGVTDIFDEYKSNFRRMINKNVHVGDIIQVTNIIVDDKNDTGISTESLGEQPIQHLHKFFVTRPFIFLVYSPFDRLVHFSAVVENPTSI